MPFGIENLQGSLSPTWLTSYERWLIAYGESFFTGEGSVDKHLTLKVEHSQRVLANCLILAQQEESIASDITLCRSLLLTGLFHDIGRFNQYSRYKTFADALSCNHGYLGVSVLKEEGVLQRESLAVRHLVYAGVGLHNRFAIPASLVGPYKLLLQAIRDADKVDILQVMEKNLGREQTPDATVVLGLKNKHGACSPEMVIALRSGEKIPFTRMRYVNDFRILLCIWLDEIVFESLRRLPVVQKCLFSIIDGMEGIVKVQAEARAFVEKRLSIPKGVEA